MTNRNSLSLRDPGKCIDNPPAVCYEVGTYSITVTLAPETGGYTIAYQRCCRIENMSNINGSGQVGATYTADVPGTNIAADAPKNSSPVFATKDTTIVCEDNYFLYDFSSTDADGDSLSYMFCSAYSGGSTNNPQPQIALAPPYTPVPYSFGFGASAPMGANVTIDSKTGIITGIAPAAGIYVITVCVNEFRKGILINIHRKDIQIKVAACTIAAAALDPVYMSCDGFTLTLQNKSNSNLIKSYYWDFGVPGVTNDTSTVARPTYTYADTGTYRIMLITNRGEECSDTAFTLAKVYPGFFPGFVYSEGCKNVPIYFTDTTKTKYGIVDSWKWDFGVRSLSNDTSLLQNSSYVFADSGTYQVALTVTNSKGCKKTSYASLVVRNRPLLSVPHDTLMCDIDTIALAATGPPGTYTWSPAYNIDPLTGKSVNVSPDVTTTYTVSLTTVPGCTSTDTVRVNVVNFVTLNVGDDLTMCLTDTVQLKPFSNGLKYVWTPVATLDNPYVKNPLATPVNQTTQYTVTAYIGKCFATDNIIITAIPYPDVHISADTSVCYGDQVQLFANGGAYYTWTPAIAINNFKVPDPLVNPTVTTTYTVSVTDTLGCPKPTVKDVLVRVIPPVPAFAGNDTVVVLGQPLQLQASGAAFYKWNPGSYLNDTIIADPVAQFESDVGEFHTYSVKVSTPEGCFAYDTINIRVFRTMPDIFVADAFTPNGDYLNDVFHAYPVGIKQFDYLRIFNRWGQLMFSTTNSEEGWNGKHNGKEQASDTFVWMVSGTDYLGKKILKKGTLILMR
ncbi:MAG: gliding motility-associated C-terminal domain-containing protein [Chitinophagaceae bacterium]|nr:gliding motility-associated C-terminal domain-containing protein [Chitinophagaceae bacterium]